MLAPRRHLRHQGTVYAACQGTGRWHVQVFLFLHFGVFAPAHQPVAGHDHIGKVSITPRQLCRIEQVYHIFRSIQVFKVGDHHDLVLIGHAGPLVYHFFGTQVAGQHQQRIVVAQVEPVVIFLYFLGDRINERGIFQVGHLLHIRIHNRYIAQLLLVGVLEKIGYRPVRPFHVADSFKGVAQVLREQGGGGIGLFRCFLNQFGHCFGTANQFGKQVQAFFQGFSFGFFRFVGQENSFPRFFLGVQVLQPVNGGLQDGKPAVSGQFLTGLLKRDRSKGLFLGELFCLGIFFCVSHEKWGCDGCFFGCSVRHYVRWAIARTSRVWSFQKILFWAAAFHSFSSNSLTACRIAAR